MNGRQGADRGAADPAAVAKRIGLDLPATARVEYVEQSAGQDDAARLVAVLGEDEWRDVLTRVTRAAGEAPAFSADANFHLGPDGDGWKPSAAAELRTAQLPWAGGREALNLGTAPAGAGRVRLFVFWHQL